MCTVLLVEDHARLRRAHRQLFVDRGTHVLEAATKEEAMSLFKRNAGLISALVADLRLVDNTDENDVSGAAVAREVKRFNPQIPTICVSAFDLADQLASDSPFDIAYRKGGKNKAVNLAENLDEVLKRMEFFERQRYSNAPKQLIDIREKYRISDSDFLTLISAVPVSTTAQVALMRIHEYFDGDDSGEGAPRAIMMLVEPESEPGRKYSIKQAIPIVLRTIDSEHRIAELYGLPSIYAYGASQDEAVDGLLESLRHYREELEAEQMGFPEAQLVRFRRYLGEIFNAS